LPTYFWWLKVTFQPAGGKKCEVFEIYYAVAEVCCGRWLIVTHNDAIFANKIPVGILDF
jgi:hypothetical protein